MSKTELKQYIESGDYYKDARVWYNNKYLLPITHRTWLFYSVMLSALMLTALAANINQLLPIKQHLTYAISVAASNDGAEVNARVVDMDNSAMKESPYRFLASALIESYLVNRENYHYFTLDKQFEYVKNSSTRLVYKRFQNYMSVNNPESPVMRYQQYAKRTVAVKSLKFTGDKEVVVVFNSIAKDTSEGVFEDLNWEAKISFDMGEINRHLASGSDFKFVVTNYSLRLLGEVK